MRSLWFIAAGAIALTAHLAAQGPGVGPAARTPWGDPDLQGYYTNNTSTARRSSARRASKDAGPPTSPRPS